MFWNTNFLKLSPSCVSCVIHRYSGKVSNQLPDLTAGWKWPAEFFHLCSLFSWLLWISSKQATSTTTLTPFYGFDVKTKQCCTGHTKRLLKLVWWEKRAHWPGFNSCLSNSASKFNFPKLPSLGWHLGWLMCPVLCVLQSNCFKC